MGNEILKLIDMYSIIIIICTLILVVIQLLSIIYVFVNNYKVKEIIDFNIALIGIHVITILTSIAVGIKIGSIISILIVVLTNVMIFSILNKIKHKIFYYRY